MAAGAVSGNGVYSDFTYKGKKFLVSQWTNDAMDAVGQVAFRIARRYSEDPRERAELNRMNALGEFSFAAVVAAGGLDRNDELLATFLYHLLAKHQPEMTLELCEEMVKESKAKIIEAVDNANPQKPRQKGKPGQDAAEAPNSGEPSRPSSKPGTTSAT